MVNTRAVWGRILRQSPNDLPGFTPQIDRIINEIINVEQETDFEDLDWEIVDELLNSHSDEFEENNLLNIATPNAFKEFDEETPISFWREKSLKGTLENLK